MGAPKSSDVTWVLMGPDAATQTFPSFMGETGGREVNREMLCFSKKAQLELTCIYKKIN